MGNTRGSARLASQLRPVRAADRSTWLGRAACRREDPELFFPASTGGSAVAQVAAAKSVCARCPVRTLCLTWALARDEDAGVWGGLDSGERRSLRNRPPRRTGRRSRATGDAATGA